MKIFIVLNRISKFLNNPSYKNICDKYDVTCGLEMFYIMPSSLPALKSFIIVDYKNHFNN